LRTSLYHQMGNGNVKPKKGSVAIFSTFEEFMSAIHSEQAEGWKKMLNKDGVEVYLRDGSKERGMGHTTEVCVRSSLQTTNPIKIFEYLSEFRKRSEWDVFFKDGEFVKNDPNTRTLMMTLHGLMPYSAHSVVVQQTTKRIERDGSFLLIENTMEGKEKRSGPSEGSNFSMLSGFLIQRLTAQACIVIAVFRFELERVLPSVLHSMSPPDAAAFFVEKYSPAFNAMWSAIQVLNGEVATSAPSGHLAKSKSPDSTTLTTSHSSHSSDPAATHQGEFDDLLASNSSSNVASNASAAVASTTSQPLEWRRGELIGAGAIGKVYMALNLNTGKIMAVKQVTLVSGTTQQEDELRSLEHEIEMFKSLRHPNIIEYIGVERSKDVVSIFLEYVSAGSIQSMLKKFGAFSEPMVRAYTRQIVDGLAYLHLNSICHRDIKGANILCANDGVIKLADFGASKKLADVCNNSTGLRSLVGTPYMMAPEVIKQSGHGVKADIWSLGCVVIEMGTGLPPWSQFKDRMAAMFHIANAKGPPELPETFSSPLRSFIAQCMELDPKARPNAEDLVAHPFLGDSKDELTPSSATAAVMEIMSPSQVNNLARRRNQRPPPTINKDHEKATPKSPNLIPRTPPRIDSGVEIDMGSLAMASPQVRPART